MIPELKYTPIATKKVHARKAILVKFQFISAQGVLLYTFMVYNCTWANAAAYIYGYNETTDAQPKLMESRIILL